MLQGDNGKDEHAEAATLAGMKLLKSRRKAVYTRMRNRLFDLCSEKDVKKEGLRECLDKTEEAMDNAIRSITDIVQFYRETKQTENMLKSLEEISVLEAQYEEVLKTYRSCTSDKVSENPEKSVEENSDIGKDLWKQLKRVSIPIFDGDKRRYESWKAAFYACIDSAPATPQYKLLQLKQYLRGEALKCVEELGHSAEAYETAKSALERKFGGARRQCIKFIEDLENFKPIRNENAKEMERFADLLDITVLKLKEMEHDSEFGKSTFYFTLLKKMPPSMLTKYIRWIHNNSKEETIETLKDWINLEAEFVMTAQETIHGISQLGAHSAKPVHTNLIHNDNGKGRQRRKYCILCNCEHDIWTCEHFLKLNVRDRWRKAKELKLCFRCLRNNHIGNDCRTMKRCGIDQCNKTHHYLLHLRENTNRLNPEASGFRPQREEIHPEAAMFGHRNEMTAHTHNFKFIALRTIPVILKSRNRSVKVNALLDDGSTKTYLNADVAAELGLQGEQRTISVNVLNNQVETFETMAVQFQLESYDGRVKKEIEAQTVNNVTGSLQVIDWKIEASKYKHLQNIEFPSVPRKQSVDILIGMDYAELHSSCREVTGQSGEPVARLTPLGWTCVGAVKDKHEQLSYHSFFAKSTENTKLDMELRRFWEIESINDSVKAMSPEEELAISIVEKSLKKEGNMYTVSLPWKENKRQLADNRVAAVKRLGNTEKRLQNNEKLREAYCNTIEKYIKKGYIKKLDLERDKTLGWYLPHFPIIKPEKETTKVRIVFDASAKFQGMCLNDVIYQGPKLQRDLFDVLMRFRKNPIAVCCDIQEMYLRVGLNAADHRYLRFLFRESPEIPIETYEFTRIVFGVNASPFLAQYVSHKNALQYASMYPLAAETVQKSTYMDDSMDSVENEEQGIELYHQLTELWGKADMHARKWVSNSARVMEEIPVEDRSSQIDLSKDELPSIKTLGVLWIAQEDCFSFHFAVPPEDLKLTKRNFLKTLASVFDPLGFIAPFVVRAKVLMQEIWVSGTDWDELINPDITHSIENWFKEIGELKSIRIPRCLHNITHSDSNKGQIIQLHAFVDASNVAYGAVVYMRFVTENDISVRLVAAKGRVVPLESTSIPRLELLSAVIGLRLTLAVCRALNILTENVIFWCDSMNVLYWIRNQSRQLKPFVANRVGEIHRSTVPNQWRYIPSKENPADDISRGMSVIALSESERWWMGPKFLQREEHEWPENHIAVGEDAKIEMRRVKLNCYNVIVDGSGETLLEPSKYSSWLRFVRVRAWIMRFIENCCAKKEDRLVGPLLAHEINDSAMNIIREDQKLNFPEEYKNLENQKEIPRRSKLVGLNPKLDSDGVMRSDGRLTYAEFIPYDTRYPIILPRKSVVTRLIVKFFHEKTNHSGTNQTLAELSYRYWVVSGREQIRECETNCMECKRRKLKPCRQIMAPLPSIRLDMPLQAFAHIAVDYGGPFITVQGRGKRREKRYLCLFTCLASRAVHLEVAFGLDTNSFLNAFYRMVNRRGLPVKVSSDNGTNFIGADKELRALVKQLDENRDDIVESTANEGIEWHFNPPLAPHWGGIHEIMIKAAKRAIYAILQKADVTDEELMTAFTGAESLINSRPLTYQSANPSDCVPLTPNHFLIGQVGGQFAPQSVDETHYNPIKRWRRVQEIVRHFWKRWLKEWLPSLNSRKKWFSATKSLETGDVVILILPDVPRGQWPLGRVTKTYPGKDGHVRTASVQVGSKEVIRPIVKLCPLELNISDE